MARSRTSCSLFGTKIALNEFVAIIDLGQIGAESLSQRSRMIVIFALCGLANFSSIAIQMAGNLASVRVAKRSDQHRRQTKGSNIRIIKI